MDASTQSFRMTGSCAMDMCHVACGRLDAYYEGRDRSYGPKVGPAAFPIARAKCRGQQHRRWL